MSSKIHWRTTELGIVEHDNGQIEVVETVNMFDSIDGAKDAIDELDKA